MENTEFWITLLILIATSALLIVTGLKKQPGVGVIGAVLIIGLTFWLRKGNFRALGFAPPENWMQTVALGLGLGILIQLLSILIIEPLSEKLTNSKHDHSILDGVKGNPLALLQWIVVVWVFVAFLEEGIYRGFLMTETAKIFGEGTGGIALNIILTSIVFGLSHGYQDRAGIVSTGIVGMILAIIFVMSGFNLWLAIFTHGFIDTVGISLIAIDGDKRLRNMILKN